MTHGLAMNPEERLHLWAVREAMGPTVVNWGRVEDSLGDLSLEVSLSLRELKKSDWAAILYRAGRVCKHATGLMELLGVPGASKDGDAIYTSFKSEVPVGTPESVRGVGDYLTGSLESVERNVGRRNPLLCALHCISVVSFWRMVASSARTTRTLGLIEQVRDSLAPIANNLPGVAS